MNGAASAPATQPAISVKLTAQRPMNSRSLHAAVLARRAEARAICW